MITGFSHAEGDRIDLSTLDANTGVAGDQAFQLIGSTPFSTAGQLRVVASCGITLVQGNVGGTLAPDFHIELTGALAFVAGDFFL